MMDVVCLSFSWALGRGGDWLAREWFFTWSWSKKQKVRGAFRAWSHSPTGRSRSAALWPVSRWMACRNLSGFPWWWAAWVPGSCLQASWHWRRDFWWSPLRFLQSGGLLGKGLDISATPNEENKRVFRESNTFLMIANNLAAVALLSVDLLQVWGWGRLPSKYCDILIFPSRFYFILHSAACYTSRCPFL